MSISSAAMSMKLAGLSTMATMAVLAALAGCASPPVDQIDLMPGRMFMGTACSIRCRKPTRSTGFHTTAFCLRPIGSRLPSRIPKSITAMIVARCFVWVWQRSSSEKKNSNGNSPARSPC